MKIGQGVGVIEPCDLGHEPLDQGEHAAGAVDETREHGAPVRPFA
jgi:hypothetical protein